MFYSLSFSSQLPPFRRDITYWVKLGEHDLAHDGTSDLTPVLKGDIPSSLYRAAELKENALATSGTNFSINGNSTWALPDPEMTSVEQVIQVEFKEVHPHYPRRYNYHDIAVVRLKAPVSEGGKEGGMEIRVGKERCRDGG